MTDGHKILCVIPARSGSKGIPKKNLIDLHGRPLLAYTIDVALRIHHFDEIVLSTDDTEMAALGSSLGISVPFLRPSHLASDTATSIDVVIHALQNYLSEGRHFDTVCLLQPTVPLRDSMDIKQAINEYLDKDADSLISVRTIPHFYNPYWAFEEERSTAFLKRSVDDQELIPRRQDLPKCYHRDGSIYITNTRIILERGSFYGDKLIGVELKNSPNINVDTLDDLQQARSFLASNPTFFSDQLTS